MDGRRVGNALGIVVASLAALVCLSALALVIGLHYALEPPDVAGEAHSAEVTAARTAAITAQDKTFATLLAGTPVLAESVEDRCEADHGMIGGKGYVSCSRRVIRYVAYDRKVAGAEDVKTEWSERPEIPSVHRDFDRGIATPQYDNQVIFADKPVDKAAVYRAAYTKHRYVAAMMIDTQYYP